MTDQAESQTAGPRRLTLGTAVVLIAVVATWGTQQAAIKVGNLEMAPVFQAALRSIGATTLLTLWFMCTRQPPWPMRVRLWQAAALGLLFSLDFSLLFLGLDHTSASRGTILYYTAPLMIALGAGVLLAEERLRGAAVLGPLLAFLGVATVLSPGQSPEAQGSFYGDMMCLAAAASWALTILLIKFTSLVEVPAPATLYFQVAGSAVLLPLLSLLLGEPWSFPVGSAPLAALAFQTVVVATASYLVFFSLLRRYPASSLSAYSFLAPVFGVTFSALVLDEPITAELGVGAGLVVAGLFLVTLSDRAADVAVDRIPYRK